jgi:hypothetical protein
MARSSRRGQVAERQIRVPATPAARPRRTHDVAPCATPAIVLVEMPAPAGERWARLLSFLEHVGRSEA